MLTWPLRFRDLSEATLFADEAGGWFQGSNDFLRRYGTGELTSQDEQFLLTGGHAYREDDDLYYLSFAHRWAKRHWMRSDTVDYVILVPTLRCNLACQYCQVSRAAMGATGYDWDDETADAVIAFLDRLPTRQIKIEFQGGEPLLRLDLLQRVRDFCRSRFESPHFVVCSNFQLVDDEVWAFFADEDTTLSTSIDGPAAVHTRQRTQDAAATDRTFGNIGEYVSRFGGLRLSALPTIDLLRPPDLEALLDTYTGFGLNSIFLRPINYQGFARRGGEASDPSEVLESPLRSIHRPAGRA